MGTLFLFKLVIKMVIIFTYIYLIICIIIIDERRILKGWGGDGWTDVVDVLAALEEEDGDLTEIEVDEMTSLVSNITAEVAANDAVPSWVVLLVEFLLYVGSDVFFDVELFEGLSGAVDCVLLHFLRHVGIFDYGFPVSHIGSTG